MYDSGGQPVRVILQLVLWIRIRTFLGHPDPSLFVRIRIWISSRILTSTSKKVRKILISSIFFTYFLLFIFESFERRTRPCHRAYYNRGSTPFHSCVEVRSPKLVSSEDRTGARAPSASYCSTEGVVPLHTAPPVPGGATSAG
jgi:hypothetical protein